MADSANTVTVTAAPLKAGPRTPGLQQASWRGIPFAVLSAGGRFGRRNALHEYPYRDKPWIEDLGRASRRISITGFLISDSQIYGGGDVIAQREQMIAAAEGEGPGILIHPTLGSLKVSLAEPLMINERWDESRYFALEFAFIENGGATFPASTPATQSATTSAASGADAAAATDFSNAIGPLLPLGGLTIQNAIGATSSWLGQVAQGGLDATSLMNLGSGLTGNFGRYFNGANAGFLGGALAQILPASTTIGDLAAIASGDRAALTASIGSVLNIVGELGLPGAGPTDMAAAVQTVIANLVVTCANPSDALRLIGNLAVYAPSAATPVAAAIGDLFRRSAVTALARISAAYQPSSQNDAAFVRTNVVGAIDAAAAIAGDAGDDATFNALTLLRGCVTRDLMSRGAALAAIVRIEIGAQLPALALAQRLYRDPSRADQLVRQVNPVHPLFMPSSFEALAS